jgi:hypothetical protein
MVGRALKRSALLAAVVAATLDQVRVCLVDSGHILRPAN